MGEVGKDAVGKVVCLPTRSPERRTSSRAYNILIFSKTKRRVVHSSNRMEID